MSSHQSPFPFEIIHHILIFAVDFRLIKSGFYSQQEQIECVAKFQSLSSALCSSMESHLTSFWLNTLQSCIVNLKFYNEEELEKELMTFNSNKLKQIVLLTLFSKRKFKMPISNQVPTITMLGDTATGKSSLCIRYVTGNLPTATHFEVVEYFTKQVELDDGEQVELKIIDPCGDECYTAMRESYIREGQAFILVYSGGNSFYLDHLNRLAIQMDLITNRCDIPMVIAINKIDDPVYALKSPRMEIEKVIKDFGWLNTRIVETSAVNEVNVSTIFEECIKLSRNGTLKDIRLLKEVISKDVKILTIDFDKEKKKCICM